MPGYKRIISYIYTYEKGERKENCGFARTEVRNGEWRIKIQLKGIYAQGQTPCRAYLYEQKENSLQGIFLGELESRNGTLEWKGCLKEDSLADKAYLLQEMRGFFLEGSGGKQYAAAWDDNPVNVNSFHILGSPLKEETAQEHIVQENAEAEGVVQEHVVQENAVPEREVQEYVVQKNAVPEREVQKHVVQEHTAQKPSVRKNDIQENNVSEEKAITRQTTAEAEPQAPQNQSLHAEQLDLSCQAEAVQPHEQKNEDAALPKGNNMDGRWEKWEYLSRHFPVQPLYQSGRPPMACIRIGPRDLQRLPRGSWILGNNSFLLHGYYQYRHLLLCRQEYEGEIEYFLAVPGIYNEKEQLMAKLFGFEEFRRSGNSGNRNGNFGYWFRRIEEA